jgi:hypothetical protein
MFPPRLSGQPIFYPVTTADYARRICESWNVKDAASGYAGFVVSFDVDDSYASKFPIKAVGGQACSELWVSAEELNEFNQHIVDTIDVLESYYGDAFVGKIDLITRLPESIAR